jgi:squalene-hopene/tetraprenyl-beta-curcumene cyclase
MSSRPNPIPFVLALHFLLSCRALALAGDGGGAAWSPERAGQYLDQRQQTWFKSARCISCHTGLPYALARSTMRRRLDDVRPSSQEESLLRQVKRRTMNWRKLDSEEFGLYYDSSEVMKKQSWDTEAVFNALILSFDDRARRQSSPSPETKQAFANLWQTQVQKGDEKGSWEWLDFNEAPWGNREARYLGAVLAAVAVRTAPGYYQAGADATLDAQVSSLKDYLKRSFPKENLHNQAWGIWAASQLDGILTGVQVRDTIERLLAKQQTDGGWSLASLGDWQRHDRTAQSTTSDGYATAMLVYILPQAGVKLSDTRIGTGIEWLKHHQLSSGAWPSISLVKKRDPASHTGKFMSDAATAFAVLALAK